MAAKARAKKRMVKVFPKANDLETHLRVVEIDGLSYVELRDFVLSTKEYGRGYWLPLNKALLNELSKDLASLSKEAS